MRQYKSPLKIEITSEQRLSDVVFDRAHREPNSVLLRRMEGEHWRDVTAAQFRDEVVGLAKGLIAAGVEHGDRVGLMARTCYEWTLVDYAVWTAGGVTVPIYESSSSEQIQWVLDNSDSVATFVENAEHESRARAVTEELPELRSLWRIDAGAIAELTSNGASVSDEVLQQRRREGHSGEVATIIYTSGTTGRPKGCELTHANMLSAVRNVMAGQLRSLFTVGDRSTLLFLPLAHSYARLIQVSCVESGTTMGHFPTTGPELLDGLAGFRPTFLLAMPRVFEKIYNRSEQTAASQGKGKIFARAAQTAIDYSIAQQSGGPGLGLRMRHALFDKLVYGKILARVGGRATHAVSGGSALGERLGHFFRGIGLTVIEGYGLTETSGPATVNDPNAIKIGTVGQPLPGVAVRIADDGEVLLQGPNVMSGYWRNEAATADSFDEEGWYRTGDIGELDAEGYLSITGRKKEILVTSGGKNVAPVVLEDRVNSHPLVSQCMVVGDNRHFVAALVTVDPEALEFWKEAHGKSGGIRELIKDPDLVAAVQEAVDRANSAVSRAESIRRFEILPVEFTKEGGQISDSMKLKR
ncbi:MAG: long-chain fatty acid--CoA ligase, partial [Nocardiopsis sp. BM-2018]